MGFEVKIPDRLQRIAALYDKKFKEEVASTLQAALEEELTVISKRTQSGIDVQGNAFDEYSKGYKQFRKRKGRDSNRVTLNFTGAMLRGLRSKVKVARGYIEGTLFFLANQRDKARWNNATRQFFGLSKEQVIRINAKIKAALKL